MLLIKKKRKKEETMKISIQFIITITAISFLSACGSGSSSNGSDVKTGQFKDSAVKGLTYETLTQNGTTDEKGTFKYKAGETVTFKIGAMEIGSAEGADILYPTDITDDKGKAIKIAQVLQTLDKDKNPDKGIDIVGQFKPEFTTNEDIQQVGFLQALVDKIKKVDEPLTLVSASQAESHMDATIFSDARPTFESVSDQNGIDSRISVEKGRLKLNPQTSESVWLLAKNPINNITEITSLSADVEFVPNARVADLGLVLELKDQSSKAMYFRIAFMDSEGSACPPDAGGCITAYVNRIVINSLYTGEFLSKEPLSVVKKNAPYIKETLEKDNELYYNSGWKSDSPSPPLSGSFKANFTIKFDRTAKKVVVKHGDKQSYFDASKLFSDFSQVQAKFFIKAQDLIHSNESVFVDNVKINNQDFDDFSATTLDTTKWKTGKFSYSGE